MRSDSDIPIYPPFNPLDKRNLGESASNALLNTPISPLPPKPFIGAGVYAIYYKGDFPAYKLLSEYNKTAKRYIPIYVGKAVPKGSRKGIQGDNTNPGKALYERLKKHSESIASANNLYLKDFFCQFLSVDDIWIPLTETVLITKFEPLWNIHLEGFGNHDPGKGRYQGIIPLWDYLHPGRDWALKLVQRDDSKVELVQKIENHIQNLINTTG